MFLVCSELYNHQHNLILEYFNHPKDTPDPLAVTPHPSPRQPFINLSISIDSPIVEFSHKWYHVICDVL